MTDLPPDAHNEFDEAFAAHTENSFYLVNSEINGFPDETNPANVMSVIFTYADSPQSPDLKKIKFWLKRSDARTMADFLRESADIRPDD